MPAAGMLNQLVKAGMDEQQRSFDAIRPESASTGAKDSVTPIKWWRFNVFKVQTN